MSPKFWELLGFDPATMARWTHPELGEIPPERFIRVAEQTDLIVDVGKFVLTHVCDELAKRPSWRDNGLTISINVSARQLARTDFVETVRNRCDVTGFPPQIAVEVSGCPMRPVPRGWEWPLGGNSQST